MERKIRILVAEADPSFAKMIGDSMKESGSGYDLEAVSSGRDCLEKLREQKFDILLLDHDLPDGKGLAWLRRFNELGVGVPTIFITAKGDSRLPARTEFGITTGLENFFLDKEFFLCFNL